MVEEAALSEQDNSNIVANEDEQEEEEPAIREPVPLTSSVVEALH